MMDVLRKKHILTELRGKSQKITVVIIIMHCHIINDNGIVISYHNNLLLLLLLVGVSYLLKLTIYQTLC